MNSWYRQPEWIANNHGQWKKPEQEQKCKKEKENYPHCGQEGGKWLLGKIPEYLLQIQTLPPHTLCLFHRNIPNKPVSFLWTPPWSTGEKKKKE